MSEPKEYHLFTIQDIFDQVPADRIGLCLDELKTLLVTNKKVIEGVKATAEAMGKPLPDTPFKFGNPLIWRDDGKGELVAEYTTNGESFMTTKITRNTGEPATE